jgi:hypothetical protein
VFLVLDALDESPNEIGSSIRRYLVENLPENVSLLCTSRDIPDITNSFLDDRRLDIIAPDSDLQTYIESYLESKPKLQRLLARASDLTQELLVSKVIRKGNGM